MSAPGITYSGVLAQKNTNVEVRGGVFQGLKFWLSARLPERKTCVAAIQDNGGKVVLKESNADLLICDPTKGSVPESYSYRLIAAAVNEGSLDTKEDYLCSTQAEDLGLPKPAVKAKLTRSSFTAKDDQLLVEFMTEQTRLGKATDGNEIYRPFAQEHPRHSWQSWRDRWVKKLKHIHGRSLLDPEQAPRFKDNVITSRQNDEEPVVKKRARFTREEDDIILRAIRRAIENREPWRSFEPYRRLASEYPQRTSVSWRDRAMNHVAEFNHGLIAKWELDVDFNLSQVEAVTTHQVTKREDDNSSATPSVSDDGGREHRSTATPQKPGVRSTQDTEFTRSATDWPASNHLASSTSPNMNRSPDHGGSTTTKQEFFRDYNIFLENSGTTSRRIPSIRGKAIDLWDLWRSVRSKEKDSMATDWQQVAEELGFDWIAMDSIPADLRQCYEEHLEPFAFALTGFNDSSDEDSTDDDDDVYPDIEEESEEPLPSSPPLRSSLKRPPVDIDLKRSSPKRRRIDRNVEIPSTPEVANRSLRNIEVGETSGVFATSSVRAQSRRQLFEPETQDFRFDTDTQAIIEIEDDDDSPSPSQQLLTEYDAASPELHCDTRASITPHHNMEQTTPTPKHGGRFIRSAEKSNHDTKPQTVLSTNKARISPNQRKKTKSRVLPSSWSSKSPAPTRPTPRQERLSSCTPVPDPKPQSKPVLPKDTPDDIIDYFISLGYTRDIVLRSLKATSWIIGNAGQVMEILKRGEPLPPRTTGVWTQRDDNSLALVYSDEPFSDPRRERKRAREMARLQEKHGPEQIALRKTYLLDKVPE